MSISKRIRKIRKKRGLTLSQLSKKTNISASYISDIEHSRSQPSLDKLKDLAKALDVRTAYLLDEIDNERIDKNQSRILSIIEEDYLIRDILFELEKIDKKKTEKILKIIKILKE